MREIKFRAWDKKYNIMIQAESFQRDQMWISGIGEVFEIGEWSDYGGGGKTEDDCSDQYILMQYTGLRDMNGKEIYEGDILRLVLVDYAHVPEQIFVVSSDSFFEDVCYLQNISRFVEDSGSETDGIEVIGNIYESPERDMTNDKKAPLWWMLECPKTEEEEARTQTNVTRKCTQLIS